MGPPRWQLASPDSCRALSLRSWPQRAVNRIARGAAADLAGLRCGRCPRSARRQPGTTQISDCNRIVAICKHSLLRPHRWPPTGTASTIKVHRRRPGHPRAAVCAAGWRGRTIPRPAGWRTRRARPRVRAPRAGVATLRRLLRDLIEQYGRHTGHASLIREAAGGPTRNPARMTARSITRTSQADVNASPMRSAATLTLRDRHPIPNQRTSPPLCMEYAQPCLSFRHPYPFCST
jgi:Protein of unknown function (DUF664)